jgi:hypothetical protein
MNQAGYAISIKRSRRRTGSTSVSSSPSKIPYGGFSPVRLQTGIGIPPRSSPAGSNLSARPACLRHPMAYTRSQFLSPERAISYRRGTCVQAVLPPSDANIPVQRSLAPRRVLLSRRLLAYYDLIRASQLLLPVYVLGVRSSPSGLVGAGAEKVPNLSHLSVTACRLLYPGSGMTALGCCFVTPAGLPLEGTGSATASPTLSGLSRGPLNEAVKFARATARGMASLATGPGVYVRAFISWVTPLKRRISLLGQTTNSRDRTSTGKTNSRIGCNPSKGEFLVCQRRITVHRLFALTSSVRRI